MSVAPPTVSIIIPTLDEATTIGAALHHLRGLHPAPHEVLVVDGGSTDETVAIARAAGARVIEAPRGRARQLNLGVEAITGECVCFLHADTTLPPDAVDIIRATLADRRISLGGFVSLMRGPTRTRWGTSLHNFLKTWYAALLFRPILFWRGARLLFGDQAMFCRREDFLAVGGFEEVAIMEEATLCIRLTARGRVRQIGRICESSDRRVARWGALKANLMYLYIGFLWGFDLLARRATGRPIVSDQRLADLYGDER